MSVLFVDREAAYPYRYKIIPDDGSTAYYAVLERADDPIVPGTPLNAETFNNLVADYEALVGGVTAEQVGAAPAGYGLGTIATNPVADCDDAVGNGWYFINMDTANTPFEGTHGAIRVDAHNSNHVVQTAYSGANSTLGMEYKKRVRLNGIWGEWEYVDPMLAVGREYRTTERYNGKPVYVKLLNFGTLPNATYKAVNFYSDETSRPISVVGQVGSSYDDLHMTLPSAFNGIEIAAVNYNQIRISTDSDRSGMYARALVKYWKKTD